MLASAYAFAETEEVELQHRTESAATPFLVNFAVTRTPSPEIGGRYCVEREVWVQETAQGVAPIVLSDEDLDAAVTKTMVQQESDDEERPFPRIFELATKTDVQQESDDRVCEASHVLELATKTSYQVESDDVSPSYLPYI